MAVTAALVDGAALGDAALGDAELGDAGAAVPGVATGDAQAAPSAALVVSSFAPECDAISIPPTTPRIATSVPTTAPQRARGRSSNTW
jgi:hypothetical protein